MVVVEVVINLGMCAFTHILSDIRHQCLTFSRSRGPNSLTQRWGRVAQRFLCNGIMVLLSCYSIRRSMFVVGKRSWCKCLWCIHQCWGGVSCMVPHLDGCKMTRVYIPAWFFKCRLGSNPSGAILALNPLPNLRLRDVSPLFDHLYS